MSTPHIAWAFAQRELTAIQRLVLIALAERANGDLTCFPSEATLAYNCELSRRSVVAAVQYLHNERGLIEVVTDPVERAAILAKAGAKVSARVNVYRILRPSNGAHAAHTNGAHAAPSNRSNSARRAPSRPPVAELSTDSANGAPSSLNNGANGAPAMCTPCTRDSAPDAHEPLTEPLQEEKRRASAPEGQDNSGGGTPPPPPASPTKAPLIGTTDGSASGYRPPGTPTSAEREPPAENLDTSSFEAFLDERRTIRATVPATIRGHVLSSAILPPDAPVGPQVGANIVRATGQALRSRNYPPRAPGHTVNEQREANPRIIPPTPHYLSGSVLAAARAAARVHAP